jgi:hypothetical protein
VGGGPAGACAKPLEKVEQAHRSPGIHQRKERAAGIKREKERAGMDFLKTRALEWIKQSPLR